MKTTSASEGRGRRGGAQAGLPLQNEDVARRLEEVAELLEAQGANPFRVRSYRTAAETVRHLPRPAHELLDEEGQEGLRRLPGIGESLARAIEELTHTDHLGLLERLRGGLRAEDVLSTVPTIGAELARRIHDQLGIESLQELEVAAWDGRLDRVPGFGRRRIQAVRESLAGRLRRRPLARPRDASRRPDDEVPVAEILDVDHEYRTLARANKLPRIAPRRFNPTRDAWLPILHTRRGERHYTALYSNTARAHELGATDDWVVIYRDDHDGHGQWTVVTARFGQLSGSRIVRGREIECREHYRNPPPGNDEDEAQTG